MKDWGFACTNEGVALVFCGDEGGGPKGKALNLLVCQCSNPRLWPRGMDHHQKSKVLNTSDLKKLYVLGVQAQYLRQGEELSHLEGTPSLEQKEVVIRMPLGHLLLEVYHTQSSERRPQGRTCWRV